MKIYKEKLAAALKLFIPDEKSAKDYKASAFTIAFFLLLISAAVLSGVTDDIILRVITDILIVYTVLCLILGVAGMILYEEKSQREKSLSGLNTEMLRGFVSPDGICYVSERLKEHDPIIHLMDIDVYLALREHCSKDLIIGIPDLKEEFMEYVGDNTVSPFLFLLEKGFVFSSKTPTSKDVEVFTMTEVNDIQKGTLIGYARRKWK